MSYRRTARRRGKQKGIVAVSRVICEIAWLLIGDRAARFTDLGPGYYDSQNPSVAPGPRSVRSNGSIPA